MKILYADLPTNNDIYLFDSPGVKVRVLFEDDGDLFMYCSSDAHNATYINKVIDRTRHPTIFTASNLAAIEDDEQFDRYAKIINDSTNYSGIHKDTTEDLDGWVPSFKVGQ